MGHPSGLYRKFQSSLLLATMTNMTYRFFTGKQSSETVLGFSECTLRPSALRYSHLFFGHICLFPY